MKLLLMTFFCATFLVSCSKTDSKTEIYNPISPGNTSGNPGGGATSGTTDGGSTSGTTSGTTDGGSTSGTTSGTTDGGSTSGTTSGEGSGGATYTTNYLYPAIPPQYLIPGGGTLNQSPNDHECRDENNNLVEKTLCTALPYSTGSLRRSVKSPAGIIPDFTPPNSTTVVSGVTALEGQGRNSPEVLTKVPVIDCVSGFERSISQGSCEVVYYSAQANTEPYIIETPPCGENASRATDRTDDWTCYKFPNEEIVSHSLCSKPVATYRSRGGEYLETNSDGDLEKKGYCFEGDEYPTLDLALVSPVDADNDFIVSCGENRGKFITASQHSFCYKNRTYSEIFSGFGSMPSRSLCGLTMDKTELICQIDSEAGLAFEAPPVKMEDFKSGGKVAQLPLNDDICYETLSGWKCVNNNFQDRYGSPESAIVDIRRDYVTVQDPSIEHRHPMGYPIIFEGNNSKRTGVIYGAMALEYDLSEIYTTSMGVNKNVIVNTIRPIMSYNEKTGVFLDEEFNSYLIGMGDSFPGTYIDHEVYMATDVSDKAVFCADGSANYFNREGDLFVNGVEISRILEPVQDLVCGSSSVFFLTEEGVLTTNLYIGNSSPEVIRKVPL